MDFVKNLLNRIKYKFLDFWDYLREHKWARILVIVLAVFLTIGAIENYQTRQKENAKNAKLMAQATKDAKEAGAESNSTGDTDQANSNGKTYTQIQFDSDQKELDKKYGKPKKGFSWDQDGNLVARGDSSKKSRDVGRIYMQALSKLDAKQIERYAYPSTVIKTLNKYYSSDNEYSDRDKFKSSVYKQVLKSMQVLDISDEIPYANNKLVVTYDVRYLDLSYKGFWLKDKDKLFSDMLETTVAEQDKDKIMNYIYDYVLDYYQSKSPQYRKGQVTLVLQKSATAGWLVTNDTDVDATAKYSDDEIDNGPVGQIESEFEDYYDDNQGAKPNWDNSNINKDANTSGKNADSSDSDANGDSSLQGSKGSSLKDPFNNQ